ncbi:MAG: hypothetical protein OHK0046_24000 [Anaerolineae bacterium]
MASFEGRGSTEQPEASKQCPKCKKKGLVYYVGSDVLHGNPFTPAADTEVEHHYECRNCQYTWSSIV